MGPHDRHGGGVPHARRACAWSGHAPGSHFCRHVKEVGKAGAGAGIVRGEMAGGERNWCPEIAMREDTHLSASPHLGCGSNNEVRIAGGVGDGIMTGGGAARSQFA